MDISRRDGGTSSVGHLVDGSPFHSQCFVCGPHTPGGIHLRIRHHGRTVEGEVTVPEQFQSYDGIVHGGIVAALLDAAMVRCVQRQYSANPVTCKLDTRYLHEAPIGRTMSIVAECTTRRGEICWANAELRDGNRPCARARGVFKLTR